MQIEFGFDIEIWVRAIMLLALWVYVLSLGDGWVRVLMYLYSLCGQCIWSVFGWFLGIGLLSTVAVWIFVR